SNKVAGAPYRMAKAERSLLSGIRDLTGGREPSSDFGEQLSFASLSQRGLELETDIEIIFKCALRASGHKKELLDPRRLGFLNRVVDQRLVDDRQHLFRH